MTNSVTTQYIKECQDEGGRLRDVVRRAPLPTNFREVYGNRFVDRPWFTDDATLRAFADDVSALMDVLMTLPQRLFDGDLARYCAALGMDDRRAKMICRLASDHPPRYARPDVYFNGREFKLLELNICTSIGGLDHAIVNQALMRVDEFREFADRHRLSYVDTGEEFGRALHALADPVAGGDRPVVAMVEWKGGLATYGKRMNIFRDVMAAAGLDVRPTEIGLLTERNGKIYLDDGTPADLVLRYFLIDEICSEPSGEEALEPILRAHEAGKTVFYATLETYLYSNKACLSMMSDPKWRSAFSREESELLDRVLPWTRSLARGPVETGGEMVDLVDYTLAHRDSLILKPRVGYAGIGTVAGWQSSEQEWREAVSSLVDKEYIVQRRVVPVPEPVCDPRTGDLTDWVAALTFFFTDAGYAGSSFVRAIPASTGAIISPSTKPRMHTTSLFTYPDEPAG